MMMELWINLSHKTSNKPSRRQSSRRMKRCRMKCSKLRVMFYTVDSKNLVSPLRFRFSWRFPSIWRLGAMRQAALREKIRMRGKLTWNCPLLILLLVLVLPAWFAAILLAGECGQWVTLICFGWQFCCFASKWSLAEIIINGTSH